MKFDLHKFLSLVTSLAPIILTAVPGGAAITAIVPVITNAIVEAEQIPGATGAAKKAHVLEIVAAGVTAVNATGKVKLDPVAVQTIAGTGIDNVISTIHVIEGAKVVKAAA